MDALFHLCPNRFSQVIVPQLTIRTRLLMRQIVSMLLHLVVLTREKLEISVMSIALTEEYATTKLVCANALTVSMGLHATSLMLKLTIFTGRKADMVTIKIINRRPCCERRVLTYPMYYMQKLILSKSQSLILLCFHIRIFTGTWFTA